MWVKYDPAGKNTIPLDKLSKFVQDVPYPLGLKDLSEISDEEKKAREKKAKRRGSGNPLSITAPVKKEYGDKSKMKAALLFIRELEGLETYDGCVTYEDTIAAMAKRGLRRSEIEVDGAKIQLDMTEIEAGGATGIAAFRTLEYKERQRKKEAMKKVGKGGELFHGGDGGLRVGKAQYGEID